MCMKSKVEDGTRMKNNQKWDSTERFSVHFPDIFGNQ